MDIIQVFEYQKLKIGAKGAQGVEFKKSHFELMSRYKEKYEVDWYDLGHNSIHFKNYVGAISLGDLCIEVLPKVDRASYSEEKSVWRNVLIDMLQTVGDLPVSASQNAQLRRHKSSILDIYFDLFLSEVETLIHRGLIKRYRKQEGNVKALKGSLVFSQHLRKNLVHKERFYTRHTVYDQQHLLHSILLQTLEVVANSGMKSSTRGWSGNLLLHFPEQKKVRIESSTFEKLNFDRKSEPYKRAIQIAELILLQYHPDIRSGKHELLAIVFDMNDLWERWVLHRLKKDLPDHWKVEGQNTYPFYRQGTSGSWRTIRPDIVLTNKLDGTILVWDTKWKIPKDGRPSMSDVHQMHSYAQTVPENDIAHVTLVYPGTFSEITGSLHKSTTALTSSQHTQLSTLRIELLKSDGKMRSRLSKSVLSTVTLQFRIATSLHNPT
ncbi:McrC family protein [Phaeocystidibacter luteus]|uniref:Restriction endonuclease n=1 Tax=Phaeocystidibacter luteus TaxID=911197 RepID=A0A6N6RHU5_9FLAO|nr:restriction endonuclease [Phaeocystidibacter luteus]KAB2810020.1 restriction endonuclease [Phaeocystidibacter luteus]